jgi:hypothetical protein
VNGGRAVGREDRRGHRHRFKLRTEAAFFAPLRDFASQFQCPEAVVL